VRGFLLEVVGVVGIIIRGNRFLVERRRLDDTIDPGIVCLPAGHVKTNERLEDALRREMMEELGIQVKEMKFVCKNFYVASNGERHHAYCYMVTDYKGEPVCKAAQEIFWVENIEKLSLEIDKETVKKMREIQKE
jgi:8-oxo-dGTP diphosphatase